MPRPEGADSIKQKIIESYNSKDFQKVQQLVAELERRTTKRAREVLEEVMDITNSEGVKLRDHEDFLSLHGGAPETPAPAEMSEEQIKDEISACDFSDAAKLRELLGRLKSEKNLNERHKELIKTKIKIQITSKGQGLNLKTIEGVTNFNQIVDSYKGLGLTDIGIGEDFLDTMKKELPVTPQPGEVVNLQEKGNNLTFEVYGKKFFCRIDSAPENAVGFDFTLHHNGGGDSPVATYLYEAKVNGIKSNLLNWLPNVDALRTVVGFLERRIGILRREAVANLDAKNINAVQKLTHNMPDATQEIIDLVKNTIDEAIRSHVKPDGSFSESDNTDVVAYNTRLAEYSSASIDSRWLPSALVENAPAPQFDEGRVTMLLTLLKQGSKIGELLGNSGTTQADIDEARRRYIQSPEGIKDITEAFEGTIGSCNSAEDILGILNNPLFINLPDVNRARVLAKLKTRPDLVKLLAGRTTEIKSGVDRGIVEGFLPKEKTATEITDQLRAYISSGSISANTLLPIITELEGQTNLNDTHRGLVRDAVRSELARLAGIKDIANNNEIRPAQEFNRLLREFQEGLHGVQNANLWLPEALPIPQLEPANILDIVNRITVSPNEVLATVQYLEGQNELQAAQQRMVERINEVLGRNAVVLTDVVQVRDFNTRLGTYTNALRTARVQNFDRWLPTELELPKLTKAEALVAVAQSRLAPAEVAKTILAIADRINDGDLGDIQDAMRTRIDRELRGSNFDENKKEDVERYNNELHKYDRALADAEITNFEDWLPEELEEPIAATVTVNTERKNGKELMSKLGKMLLESRGILDESIQKFLAGLTKENLTQLLKNLLDPSGIVLPSVLGGPLNIEQIKTVFALAIPYVKELIKRKEKNGTDFSSGLPDADEEEDEDEEEAEEVATPVEIGAEIDGVDIGNVQAVGELTRRLDGNRNVNDSHRDQMARRIGDHIRANISKFDPTNREHLRDFNGARDSYVRARVGREWLPEEMVVPQTEVSKNELLKGFPATRPDVFNPAEVKIFMVLISDSNNLPIPKTVETGQRQWKNIEEIRQEMTRRIEIAVAERPARERVNMGRKYLDAGIIPVKMYAEAFMGEHYLDAHKIVGEKFVPVMTRYYGEALRMGNPLRIFHEKVLPEVQRLAPVEASKHEASVRVLAEDMFIEGVEWAEQVDIFSRGERGDVDGVLKITTEMIKEKVKKLKGEGRGKKGKYERPQFAELRVEYQEAVMEYLDDRGLENMDQVMLDQMIDRNTQTIKEYVNTHADFMAAQENDEKRLKEAEAKQLSDNIWHWGKELAMLGGGAAAFVAGGPLIGSLYSLLLGNIVNGSGLPQSMSAGGAMGGLSLGILGLFKGTAMLVDRVRVGNVELNKAVDEARVKLEKTKSEYDSKMGEMMVTIRESVSMRVQGLYGSVHGTNEFTGAIANMRREYADTLNGGGYGGRSRYGRGSSGRYGNNYGQFSYN